MLRTVNEYMNPRVRRIKINHCTSSIQNARAHWDNVKVMFAPHNVQLWGELVSTPAFLVFDLEGRKATTEKQDLLSKITHMS